MELLEQGCAGGASRRSTGDGHRPARWRGRFAVIWGDSTIVSELRLPNCPGDARSWNVYAGGFYLAAPACAPVRLQYETRSATVWFGVGRRCAQR